MLNKMFLLLDRHSTHYQPQSVRFAKEHGVIMLCLPPHTTHESQPLDCGVFGRLKAQGSHVCHIYFQKHPGKVITRFQFSTLFSGWGRLYLLVTLLLVSVPVVCFSSALKPSRSQPLKKTLTRGRGVQDLRVDKLHPN